MLRYVRRGAWYSEGIKWSDKRTDTRVPELFSHLIFLTTIRNRSDGSFDVVFPIQIAVGPKLKESLSKRD
jgi:hypothetical protein